MKARRLLALFAIAALIAAVSLNYSAASADIFSNFTVSLQPAGLTEFKELHKYAHLCAVVYCLKKGLGKGVLGEQGDSCPAHSCTYDGVSDLEVAKTFSFSHMWAVGSGFLALDHDEGKIVVVFRGSASSFDWIHNFAAIPRKYEPFVQREKKYEVAIRKKCKNCKIHKGFDNFLRSGAKYILDGIQSLKSKHPDYDIVVTGHSLGGALSVLLGVELRLLGYDTLVVTLGGPKVGNKNFAAFVDSLFQTSKVEKFISTHESFDKLKTGMIRATHRRDVVPFLPPLSYFRQTGFQYYLNNEEADQTVLSVKRRGTDYIEYDKELEYVAILPSGFSRNDHVNYFFKITGCHDL